MRQHKIQNPSLRIITGLESQEFKEKVVSAKKSEKKIKSG